jgi:ADP-ribose pyrophosphatase YjhB (NUDIX family)
MEDETTLPSWRRAAAYVVCVEDDRILLARVNEPTIPDHGSWTMPGGGMEWGETPEETAIREFHEETGLTPTLGQILGTWSFWVTAEESIHGETGHVIAPIFSCTSVTGELRVEVGGTTDAVEWVPLADVASLRRVTLVDHCLALWHRHQTE